MPTAHPLCLLCCAGNVVFLPKGAIFIDVVPELNADKHTWAFFLGRDYMSLQVRAAPAVLPGRARVHSQGPRCGGQAQGL